MRIFESFLKNVSSNVDNKTKHDKLFQRLFIACLIFSSVVLSSIIPPVQSPDEIQHLYRAYSFAHGSITGVTVNNVTGDYIDTGLIKFIKSFEVLPFHPEKKLTKNDIELAKTITFTGEKSFCGSANSFLYSPLSYLPHAVGIIISEKLGLKVYDMFLVIRGLNVLSICSMLWVALKICPFFNPISMILLVLPMSLFQIASTTTDGIHFAMVVLISSLFCNLSFNGYNKTYLLWLTLITCVLSTHRINFALLFALPLILFYGERKKIYLLSSALILFTTLGWVAYAMMFVKSGGRNKDMIAVLIYYLKNPTIVLKAYQRTFTNRGLVRFYWESFVGQLGWLDYKVGEYMYQLTAIFLPLASILSFGNRWRFKDIAGLLLTAAIFIGSYFILLVQWTPYPVKGVIEGIQGRYLIPIFILGSYFIVNINLNVKVKKFLYIGIVLYYTVSLADTVIRTMERYYI